MQFAVCDDAIDPALADAAEQLFLSPELAWHFFSNVNYNGQPPEERSGAYGPDPRFEDAFGFSRLLFPTADSDSKWLKCCIQLLHQFTARQGLAPQHVFRIKANLLVRSAVAGGPKPFTPHVDLPRPHWVVIYYVNDSDGDTVLLDRTFPDWENASVVRTVSPKKGRCLLFDGRHYHCGTSPARHDTRVVLNFDFL